MCRELLVSWRDGVCSWPCWAPDPQALATVASGSVLWSAVLGGLQKTGGRGRHWVPALGPGKAAASQSLLLVGVV